VHPLTPAIRSWQALAVLGFFVARETGEGWLGGDRSGPSLPLPGDGVGPGVWFAGGGLLLAVLAVIVGSMALSWRMTRFRIGSDRLELRRGVLFRQHRSAQLDRLQAVDVSQPFLARLFGLARVTVEVAGAGASSIELAYLGEREAQELRNRLLAGAAGLEFAGEVAPEAPEHSWLEVPPGRLISSIALSGATLSLVVISIGLIVVAAMTRNFAAVGGIIPTALGIGGMVWTRFTRGFGFRVATSPDGLRLRHGLLETRTQTVPPGRVQAVRISQPLLWRRLDWWQVEVNIAGYRAGRAGSEGGGTDSTVLPVGTRADALAVAAFVAPDLGVEADEHPRPVVDAGLVGTGAGHGFVCSPPAARWFDWVSWRRNGFRVTRTVLLIRRGVLVRSLVLVPHARTQSLGVHQGLLQRRLGLASFALHSTPGPISPVVAHLDVAVAAELLAAQAERSRQARAAAGPERWMRRVGTTAPTGPIASASSVSAGSAGSAGSAADLRPFPPPAH
jgi:putative membrane protein